MPYQNPPLRSPNLYFNLFFTTDHSISPFLMCMARRYKKEIVSILCLQAKINIVPITNVHVIWILPPPNCLHSVYIT